MEQSISPATRPSRLPLIIHLIALGLLLLSFVSGAMAWYGQTVNSQSEEPSFNVRAWLLLHGYLNPFLCILFGYLLCNHIRYGWQLKANWMSGLFMELVFAALILTGAGIYYFPEQWRSVVTQVHHVAGLLLPLSLTIHWIASQLWVKNISNNY
jgi:hypothetical protein